MTPPSSATATTETNTTKQTPRKYNWAEISKHNTAESNWLVIHGKVYDTTQFLSRHPGGDMLLIAAGRHSTELFLSHHPSSVIDNKSLLEKYYIGDVDDVQPVLYDEASQTDFYPTMRKRVEQYLKENNLPARDCPTMYLKTALILTVFTSLYFIVHMTRNIVLATLLSIVWGCVASLIGMGIMHDANHGGYSNNPTINRIMGGTFDFIGGSSFCWKMIHSVGHHVSTNVDELDPDIHTNEPHFRKIKDSQKHHFWYKYQHIYLPFLYSILVMELYFRDFPAMLLGKWGGVKFQPVTRKEWIIFYASKFWVLVYALIIPTYCFQYGNWYRTLWLLSVMLGVASEILVIMFQVNHVTDLTEQFHTDNMKKDGIVMKDWAKSQVLGSSNFASGSWLWNHLSGGLNHQTEHHLFPTICHLHYPALSHIVRKTCEEYGVRYNTYPSFWAAAAGHFNLLKQKGAQGYAYIPQGLH
jgi:fatty acid desaturase